MREKITKAEEIEEAFQAGHISKTTYWRAKKRGWCWVGYHTKEKTSNAYIKKHFELFYWFAFKKALAICNSYILEEYYPNIRDIARELQHTTILELLERGVKIETREFITAIISLKIREYAFRKKEFRRYFLIEYKSY
jgi:hypothetical protein